MQTVATAKPQVRPRREGLTEWLVIGLVILALIAGWVLKVSIQGQTAPFASETLSVHYPVDWLLGKDEEALFTVTDPDSPSTFKTTFSYQAPSVKVSRLALRIIKKTAAKVARAMATAAIMPFQGLNSIPCLVATSCT